MPPTTTRKVACAAHTFRTGSGDNAENHVAVFGEIVEVPDDARTKDFTEKGYLVDPDTNLDPVSAATAATPGSPVTGKTSTGGTQSTAVVTAAQLQAMSSEEAQAFLAAHPDATVRLADLLDASAGDDADEVEPGPGDAGGLLSAERLAAMDVGEVKAHLAENPDQADHVRSLEQTGKARKGVLELTE